MADQRQKLLQALTKRDVLGEVYTRARAEYEDAARNAHETLDALMQEEESLCHKLIKSGRNPLYCKLQRGHDGQCWSKR